MRRLMLTFMIATMMVTGALPAYALETEPDAPPLDSAAQCYSACLSDYSASTGNLTLDGLFCGVSCGIDGPIDDPNWTPCYYSGDCSGDDASQ